MRHSFKWLWGFIPLALVLWLAMSNRGPVITQDVTTRAQAQMKAEGFSWASVNTRGRDVTVAGMAQNDDSRAIAVSSAERVHGVRLVNDTTQLVKELKPYPFMAEKAGNAVTLSGAVPSDAVRTQVLEAAKKAFSDAKLTDKTEIARGAPEGFAALTGFSLTQLSQLSTGKLALSDKALSLEGAAPSVDVYNSVTKAVQSLPAGGTLAKVAITLPNADPFAMAGVYDGKTLTLTGVVGSDADRKAIVDAAKAAYPKTNIVDQMQLASGSPDGFAALSTYGLNQLSQLASGKMSLVNKALSVEGVAPDAKAFAAVHGALKTLPVGGTLAKADVQLPVAKPFKFEALSDGQMTTLSGFVGSDASRETIVKAVKGANTDKLVMASGEPQGFANVAGAALGQLGKLVNGKVSLIDNAVSIEGLAADQATHDAVMAAMKAQPAGYTLASANIAVKKNIAKPYLMTIERTANGVVLKGHVPNEEAHKALIAAAREAFPGANITDQITIADGVPAGMDWVKSNRFAVAQLAKLKSGVASFRDEVFSLTGEAADAETSQAVMNALKAAQGFKLGTATIKAPEAAPVAPSLPATPPPPAAPVPTPSVVTEQPPSPKMVCQKLVDEAIAGEVILFFSGSDRIKTESQGLVKRVADTINKCTGFNVAIEGHTDADGDEELNQALSERRAKSVTRALVELGVAETRLQPAGFGKSRPVADNDTAEGKAKNRRIEFIVKE